MSYERFLPESSMNKWMNILESDQSILSFVNKLRSGNYPTRGINKTLDFIKGDGSEERISNAALLTDISEEDIHQFGEDMKEAIRSWSAVQPKDKPTLRMSNIGKPARQLWYDRNSKIKAKDLSLIHI